MDHRDAMSEFGTYLKSLPEFEFNQATMTATFVESGEDREIDSPPKRERSKLELFGAKLDALIADKADRLSDKLRAYTNSPWHGFHKHIIHDRRSGGDVRTIKSALLESIRSRDLGHFAKVYFNLSEFGRDHKDYKTGEPLRIPVQRMIFQVSLGPQGWFVPEGGTWQDRYWPKTFGVTLMVYDQEIGGLGWHFKAPFQFTITGLGGIHTLAEVGRRVNRRLFGEVTPKDLKPQLDQFMKSHEGYELQDYDGNHQGWAVSDEVLAEARKELGDWVLHFLSLDNLTHTIYLEWDVCRTCDGRGKHVNPSIDAHGISSDEFVEDPDFAEDYFRGVYDVPCYECKGRTTSPVIDMERTSKETIQFVNQWFESEASYRREVMAERRMGA